MLLWALTIHHKIIDEEVRFCLKFWRKIQILIQKLLEAYAWQRKHQKIKNKKPKASSYSVRCSVIIYTNRSYEASATNRTFLPHEQKKKTNYCVYQRNKFSFLAGQNKKPSTIKWWEAFTFQIFEDEVEAAAVEGPSRFKRFNHWEIKFPKVKSEH